MTERWLEFNTQNKIYGRGIWEVDNGKFSRLVYNRIHDLPRHYIWVVMTSSKTTPKILFHRDLGPKIHWVMIEAKL